MELQQTDDIYHIVYHTYRGDRALLEDNHFCHPGGVVECATHTTAEIFDSIGKIEDTEFYVVMENEGLVGFVTYHSGMSNVLNFGVTIAHRRASQGYPAKFLGLVRNFGNKAGVSIKVCSTNKRDILMLQAAGYRKEDRGEPDYVSLVAGPLEEKTDIRAEMARLSKLKREIEHERRVILGRFRERLSAVQTNIKKLSAHGNQLTLF